MTTKEEKRQLLIEFGKWVYESNVEDFLSTLPDEGVDFKRCGQGENTCNCKSPDECGYKEINEGIAKLKH